MLYPNTGQLSLKVYQVLRLNSLYYDTAIGAKRKILKGRHALTSHVT
jgi:hypothetical protein